MTTAAQVWFGYLALMFILMPVIFWMRFGKWPFAVVLSRFSGYSVFEVLYAAALGVYSWWLVTGVAPDGNNSTAGTVVVGLGALWIVWAILTMGRSWRIGQDERDPDVEYIRGGPFTLMPHPIYTGMFAVGVGMLLLDTGTIARPIFLLVTTLLYTLIQSFSEKRRWSVYRT